MFFSLARSFLRRRDGTVSIIGAIALPMLVAFGSLVVEFGHGLLAKAEIQRVADLASYAGGLAYAAGGSASSMTAAAQNVAVLNGVPASAVTVSLITSPKNASNQAVLVSIAKTQMLLLAPVVNFNSSVPIGARSYSQLGAKASACVIALGATGVGVNLSGSTSITAPTCAVASNANVSAPCGTTITDNTTTYNGTLTAGCSNIVGSQTKKAVVDPLAANAGVLALSAHVSAVNALSSPLAPTLAAITTGADLTFGSSVLTTPTATLNALTAQLCVAVGLLNQWLVTCPLSAVVSFGNVTVQSGVTVSFNQSAITPTTYNFSGQIVNNGTIIFGPGTFNIAKSVSTTGGATTTFGAGTFNIAQSINTAGGATATFGSGTFTIAQGVYTAGGATATFGAGTFTIGPESTACTTGVGLYSVCNLGTTTFAGSSTFVLSNGIYNGGGATASFGATTSLGATAVLNSFQIGMSTPDGYALNIGGGSTTTFGDATGTPGLFQMTGNVSAPNGGSCLTIGKAAQHDINGYISTAAGTMFGSGVYTVGGYIAMGYVGGGNSTCNGVVVGAIGTGVTFVTGAAPPTSSVSLNCTSAAFCISSGFSDVALSAPTTGPYANLLMIGPTSYNTSGFALTGGVGQSTLNGAIYFPYGTMTLKGNAGMAPTAGKCLQVVVSQIDFSGSGSMTPSMCFSGSASSWNVALVQ